MKAFSVLLLLFAISLHSCQKCKLSGESVLIEEFNEYGNWELYSEYSDQDEFFSRIEDGCLKLKTTQGIQSCQRATYYFYEDFSEIKGFEVCMDIKELIQPKNIDLHFFFALGKYEMHGTIEKRKTTDTHLVFKVNDKGVKSNLKGALFGKLGNKIESNSNPLDFIQISMCPEDWEESDGEMYVEIERIALTTL